MCLEVKMNVIIQTLHAGKSFDFFRLALIMQNEEFLRELKRNEDFMRTLEFERGNVFIAIVFSASVVYSNFREFIKRLYERSELWHFIK